MTIAHSKLTAQGQISVPAELRRKLGIGPGSVLEWEEQGELVFVRRAGRYSSQEIHEVLFRTEDYEGVKDFASGCMRTYLILKEKAGRFNADPEIQALLAEINADQGGMSPYQGAYTPEKAYRPQSSLF